MKAPCEICGEPITADIGPVKGRVTFIAHRECLVRRAAEQAAAGATVYGDKDADDS